MRFQFLVSLFILGLGPLIHADVEVATYEVTYEVFSLPQNEAAKLTRKNPGGTAMYALLVSKVGKNNVRQEKWMILKMAPNENSNLETFEELIYPSEYDPDKFTAIRPADSVGLGRF